MGNVWDACPNKVRRGGSGRAAFYTGTMNSNICTVEVGTRLQMSPDSSKQVETRTVQLKLC